MIDNKALLDGRLHTLRHGVRDRHDATPGDGQTQQRQHKQPPTLRQVPGESPAENCGAAGPSNAIPASITRIAPAKCQPSLDSASRRAYHVTPAT